MTTSFTMMLESNLTTQRSDNFTIRFDNPIQLIDPDTVDASPTQWYVALNKLHCWYSWHNIAAEKGNNLMKYNNGVVDRNLVIPDGQYQIFQINQVLEDFMKSVGDFTVTPSGNEYHIIMTPNFSTGKVRFVITNGFSLDLTVGSLHELLGFNPQVLPVGIFEGEVKANINDSINTLYVKTDVTESSASWTNDKNEQALLTFVPNSGPGTNIEIIPIVPMYQPVSVVTNQLKRINMQITDNSGRPINFNGEPVSYALHFEKRVLF